MKKTYFLLLSIILLLSSCFIADDLFTERETPQDQLDYKVEKEISKYIKDNSENYIYKNYGFSELIIKKPVELIVLDDLKRQLTTDSNQTKTTQQIEELEKSIKKNNIRYTIEMDHIYSLKKMESNKAELFETTFILADSLKIINLMPLLNVNLFPNNVIDFENYFYENPIFLSGNYENNKLLSVQFYDFLKYHQNQLKGVKEKSNFLKHSLKLCHEIKQDGNFDQNYYLLKLSDQHFRGDSSTSNYKSIEYSELYETIIDDKVVNYYFFHKFMNSNNNISDTLAVQIEFTPYYELTNIFDLKKPFNNYFND